MRPELGQLALREADEQAIGIARDRWREPTTMADELSMALRELLRKAELEQDADFLREGVRLLS